MKISKFQTLAFVLGLLLISTTGYNQDTLNFIYQKTKVQGVEDSRLTSPEHKVFISGQKRGKEYNTIYITLDSSKYEIHWQGSKRELFKGTTFLSKLNYIIVPFAAQGQYGYTIDNIEYLFKKDKGVFGCFAGDEKIMTVDFYKKDKVQIVQLVTMKVTPNDEDLKVATLYCADDLIRNKRTTFGKAWRTAGMLRLVK